MRAHLRQRLERRPARRVVAEPAASASANSAGSFFGARPSVETRTISATARRPSSRMQRSTACGVLARQRPLGRVVAAALGAEDQEAAQPRPVVDGPGEAAGRVRDLARERRRLRHAARAVTLQIRHDAPPFTCVGVLNGVAALLLCKLGLRGKTVAEALQRAEQRVDLEQRVLAQLGRLERELEANRVRAVGDLQHEPPVAIATSPARVLDEDAHVGAAVKPGRFSRVCSSHEPGRRAAIESGRRAYCVR